MTTDEKIAIISSHFLFKDLAHQEITWIAEKTNEKKFEAKTILIQQNDRAEAVYFIYEGLVRVYITDKNGDEITISMFGRHEIIGEMAIIDNDLRSATVETIQDTSALKLTKQAFIDIIKQHPSIALHLMKILTYRLRNNTTTLEINHSWDLKNRTLNILQTLAQYFPNKEITLSQEELALIIGGTRPRITELLNELEKEGHLILSYRRITLF